MNKQFTRPSANILLEAAEIQQKKSQDYQNPLSRVRQADHYPRGVYTILDTVNGKLLRMYSVLETMEAGGKVNFESVEDSALDAINYLSFLVAYMRGEIDGQTENKDVFNRRITKETHPTEALVPQKFKTTNTITVEDPSKRVLENIVNSLVAAHAPQYTIPSSLVTIDGKITSNPSWPVPQGAAGPLPKKNESGV